MGGGTRTGSAGARPPYGLVRYRSYGTAGPDLVRNGGPGSDRDGAAGRCQPLTAPDMMPPTICLPKITKTTSSGRVLISAPAMTMLWSGT